MIEHRVNNKDAALFEKMAVQYQSEEERTFFKKLHFKEENVLTVSHDLILHEDNNEDGLYFVRCEYEEYIVGQTQVLEEQHVMCLADALSLNLKEVGLLDKDMTFFDWLRKRNYKGVEYEHNYDNF